MYRVDKIQDQNRTDEGKKEGKKRRERGEGKLRYCLGGELMKLVFVLRKILYNPSLRDHSEYLLLVYHWHTWKICRYCKLLTKSKKIERGNEREEAEERRVQMRRGDQGDRM